REDLALRMQPVGARLETRRAVVGQLAIELVLAGTGGKYRVVLEVAIEKAVHRRSQRAAGDGGRGLCGCGGGRWCGLRGWRWRGRAAGKECRGGDGGQREYTECAHGRSSPGWKAQPRCYGIPMQSRRNRPRRPEAKGNRQVDEALPVVCSPISVISVDGSCRTCARIGSGVPGPDGILNSARLPI